MEHGEEFVPVLTAKRKPKEAETQRGKKRKNTREGGRGSPKRRKNDDSGDEDDDDFIDDDEEMTFSDEDEDSDKGSEKGSDDEDEENNEDDGSENENEDEDEEEEEVTEETLKAKILEADTGIKEGRIALSEQRRLRKEAMDALATIKKRQTKAQRAKNAFCSLKRSEVSSI